MKKYYPIILVLLALVLLGGCSKDATDSISTDEDGKVDLELAITRSVGNTNGEAVAAEMDTKDIYVYIFDAKGKLENPNNIRVNASPLLTSVDATTDKINQKWRIERGVKSIYVVFNGERAMGMSYPADFSYGNSSYPYIYTDFINAHSPKTDPLWYTEQYGGTAYSTTPKNVDADMVTRLNRYTDLKMMSGYVENFKADLTDGTCVVTVPVYRRYAAVELRLRKSEALASATVAVKQIRFRHISASGSIFEAPATAYDPYDYRTSKNNKNLTDADGDGLWYVAVDPDEVKNGTSIPQSVTAVAPGTEYTAMQVSTYEGTPYLGNLDDYNTVALNLNRFYIYPRSAAASLKAGAGVPEIEITAMVGGKETTYTAYLSELKDGKCDPTQPLDILGNHIYRVEATLTPQSMDVQLNILDWNDQKVNGDIYGASLEVNKTVFNIPVGSSETLTVEAVEPSTTFTFLGYGNAEGTGTMSSTTPTGYIISGQPEVGVATSSATVTIESKTGCGAVYMWYRAGNIKKRVELASNIDPANYVFEVTSPASFTHSGGTHQYTVTSYLKGTTNTPVKWTALEVWNTTSQKWEKFTTQPASWVTTFSTSGNGSDSATGYDAKVAAQNAKTTGSLVHDDILKAAAEVGTTANPYDLSNGGETANCYIVNAPGTYCLPLVYGNARNAAGTVNTPAFKPGVGLSPFLSATGTIPDDGLIAGATSAQIVWQDEKQLITTDSIRLSTDGKFLRFYISRDKIKQGNAVVSVKGTSGVLWSWHIWVTDYVLGSDDRTFVNFQKQPYTFMPINLGWCAPGGSMTSAYAGRSVKVRFTQAESGLQREIDIVQPAEGTTKAETGNSCYYQWGRKDPFVGNKPATSTGDIADPPFTTDWKAGNNVTAAGKVITNCILNPRTYCANLYMDYYYYNLWSATCNTYGCNDLPVTKTVYDPSPVGYHMPAGNAFTGFSTTGTTTTTESQFNKTGNFDKGWTFSKVGSDDVFFPAVYYRNAASGAMYFGTGYVYCWSSASDGPTHGVTLVAGSAYVGPHNSYYRAYGFPVRPVKNSTERGDK